MNKTIYPVIADADALPFTLTGAGISDGMRPVSCKNGIASHQFLMTAGGEGIIHAAGQTLRQSRGSFVYIAAGVPYSFEPEGNDWSAEWLTVSGSMSGETLQRLGFTECTAADDTDTEECGNLIGQIMTAAAQPIPNPRIVSTLVYAFILAARTAVLQKDTDSYNCSIDSSVDHINRHYGENITLERLAGISGVSLQHFCRVFRAKLGMRPMEYLARTRVAEAKKLLGETDERISDIARSVGFEDQNYFGITFRKYEGVSPTEYRKERGISERNGGTA